MRARLRTHRRRAGPDPATTTCASSGRASSARGVHHVALLCSDVERTVAVLPGPARVPAHRDLREPGLPGLEPLLLRHRQRQPARLLRPARPRPRRRTPRCSAACTTSPSRSSPSAGSGCATSSTPPGSSTRCESGSLALPPRPRRRPPRAARRSARRDVRPQGPLGPRDRQGSGSGPAGYQWRTGRVVSRVQPSATGDGEPEQSGDDEDDCPTWPRPFPVQVIGRCASTSVPVWPPDAAAQWQECHSALDLLPVLGLGCRHGAMRRRGGRPRRASPRSSWAWCARCSAPTGAADGFPAYEFDALLARRRRRCVPRRVSRSRPTPTWPRSPTADLVVVPAHPMDRPIPDELGAALRRRRPPAGAYVVSLCSGRVRAGRGRAARRPRAAPPTGGTRTSWPAASRSPTCSCNALYVEDGPILTSAGTAAGIDACLHLVRQVHGSAVATKLARRMVVPPQRSGGQAQFVEAPGAASRRTRRRSSRC